MAVSIVVDEKACVGCSLCVDVCPTKVFEFNEAKAVPEVKKSAECFGCLSCSEICPATALDHRDYPVSESYYHDPDALQLMKLLGTAPRTFNVPAENSASLDSAVEELGIRLLSVASVLKQTLGQSLPAIGTQAGRSLASQLPRYQEPQSFAGALELTKKTFMHAWDVHFEHIDNKLSLTVTRCFIREVCQKNKMELGGDLCVLFYNYLAGYLSKTGSTRPRLMETKRGENECVYSIRLHAPAGGN